MSNFTFGYSVFKSRLLQRHQKASTSGKGLGDSLICFVYTINCQRSPSLVQPERNQTDKPKTENPFSWTLTKFQILN